MFFLGNPNFLKSHKTKMFFQRGFFSLQMKYIFLGICKSIFFNITLFRIVMFMNHGETSSTTNG